jgi:hypothetical protein
MKSQILRRGSSKWEPSSQTAVYRVHVVIAPRTCLFVRGVYFVLGSALQFLKDEATARLRSGSI